MPYTRGVKPPFDVRDYIDGAEQDPSLVQVSYDFVNLMAILYGDLTLDTLFKQPWDSLLPDIASRVPTAISYQLASPQSAITDQLQQLATIAPGQTFLGQYDVPPDDAISASFAALWQQGVLLPAVSGCLELDAYRVQAIEDLLFAAPRSRYYDIFTAQSPSPDYALAMQAAADAGVFALVQNWACCSNGKCVQPATPGSRCTGAPCKAVAGVTPCPPVPLVG